MNDRDTTDPMSEDKEKPGVVIDVEPEREPDADTDATQHTEAPPTEEDAAPPRSGGQKAALLIALLSLLLVVVAVAMAYRYTRQAADDLARLQASLQQSLEQQQALQQRLDEAKRAVAAQAERIAAQEQKLSEQAALVQKARDQFAQQGRRLDSEREQMEQREAELRAAVADVHKRVGASGTQWMVAEAEYLLRLANERLNLARDVATARAALLLADQRLRDTGDPGWSAVREQIARDIATLDAAELPDLTGVSARLSALAEQVPQLKLAHSTLGGSPRSRPEPAEATPREARSWQTLLDDLWAGFKQTVRIRRNDKPVQAMLPPEQQYFLYENLRLHLEGARLALARGDERLYHDNLAEVRRALDEYFDPRDAVTRRLRDAVQELDQVRIRPSLPDISGSLAALQAREKLLADLGRPIAPEKPARPAERAATGTGATGAGQ
ncbi:MAG TPA: hypothetical protein ENJ94_10615 [Gammaproteobacteria bacterium]|nr:hypothetical protein [Gammaproteobacteria bacterium]